MYLLWLSLGTDSGLTLIKLSDHAQTLDHEYYNGCEVMGQLYYSDTHHVPAGERWEDKTAIWRPASFALQNRLLNFLTRDFRFTFLLHRLTHAVAANEHLSLEAMIQCAVSERNRTEAERQQESGEMWLRQQSWLYKTKSPCLTLMLLYKLLKS